MNSPKSAKGFGLLAGSTVTAQLILLIAAPVLTRIYSPEEFGGLSVFVSVSVVLSVIYSLRYEMAVMIPDSFRESESVVFVSIITCSIGAGLTCIMLWLFGDLLSELIGIKTGLLYLIPVAAFFIAFNKTLMMLPLKIKRYGSVALSRVLQSLGVVIFQIILSPLGAAGLLVGHISGFVLSTFAIKKYLISALSRKKSFSDAKKAAIKYKKFPLYSTWGSLQGVLGVQLPPIIYGYYFGLDFVGLYALAHRIVAAPISVLGEAVSKFFLAESAGDRSRDSFSERIFTTHRALVEVGLPFFVLLYIFGESFFVFAFGQEWAEAGEIVIAMIPWMALVFTVSPLSSVYEITERQHVGLIFNAILFVGRIALLLWGGANWSALETVVWFSMYSAFVWLGMLVWLYLRHAEVILKAIRLYFWVVLSCGVLLVPLFVFRQDVLSYSWFFALQVFVVAGYCLAVLKMRFLR